MVLWYKIHKWVSLICTIFFLLFCITALPLIFKNEIKDFNTKTPQIHEETTYTVIWQKALEHRDLIKDYADDATLKAITVNPHQSRVIYKIKDNSNGENTDIVTSHGMSRDKQIAYFVDDNTVLDWPNRDNDKYPFITKFMYLMHLWHASMGFGMIGAMFLGVMCLLCLISVISGIVLYAPFMRHKNFAEINKTTSFTKWVDWHKLLGMLTSVWAFLLCLSGTMMVILLIMYGMYIAGVQKDAGKSLPTTENIVEVTPEKVIEFVKAQNSNSVILAIDMPDIKMNKMYYKVQLTSPEKTIPIAEQIAFVGIDKEGELTYFTKEQPDYLKFSSFITDLHVNNHNTIILKIVWGILDILTIIVVISGFIAWWQKSRKVIKRLNNDRVKLNKINNLQNKKQIWFIPAVIIILSALGMVMPIYEFNAVSEFLWIVIFIICICQYIKHK